MQQQHRPRNSASRTQGAVLGEVFAPWVHGSQSVDRGFRLHPPPGGPPTGSRARSCACRSPNGCAGNGGIVCGQALMAFADTAMVIANLAANRGYRPMTTVDQTTHFMRAVTASDVLADARVVRLGRTMELRPRHDWSSATDNKPVAMVSSAFAMLYSFSSAPPALVVETASTALKCRRKQDRDRIAARRRQRAWMPEDRAERVSRPIVVNEI